MKRKSKITSEQWDEVLAGEENCGPHPLVEDRKNPGVQYMGITMNYPRTKAFLNLNSVKQKELYKKLFYNIKNTFNIEPEHEFKFEFTKHGQVHLHGYIKLDIANFYIAGALSDMSKAYLQCLPLKYRQFKEADINIEYRRFRCPSLCLQYYDKEGDINDPSTITYWKAYINKEQ